MTESTLAPIRPARQAGPETTITVTDLVERLPDVLARVQHNGDRFVIERDGEAVALLAPAPTRQVTIADLAAAFADIPPLDDEFASDIEAAKQALRRPDLPEWPE